MAEDIEDDVKDNVEDSLKNNLEESKTDESIVEPDITPISPGLNGPGPGVLEKIASIFRKKPDEEEEEDDTKDSEIDVGDNIDSESDEPVDDNRSDNLDTGDEVEEDFNTIDQRFVDAARAYGWVDSRIVDYAEKHDDFDVIRITRELENAISKNRVDDEIDDNKPDLAFSKLAEKDPELADLVKQVIEPLAKRFEDTNSDLDTLKGTLGDYELERKEREEFNNQTVADEIFDASGFSSLGKTEDIPRYPDGTYVQSNPVVRERQKIWKVAQMFYTNGVTFKDSMNQAMQWYRGSSAEKDIKHKVIKDLKEQENRVMPKRQDVKVEKEYASDEERKAAVINDAVRKYNKEFPA